MIYGKIPTKILFLKKLPHWVPLEKQSFQGQWSNANYWSSEMRAINEFERKGGFSPKMIGTN